MSEITQCPTVLQIPVDQPDVKRNIRQVFILVSEDKATLILKDYSDAIKSQSWKDHIPTILAFWITLTSVETYKNVYGIRAATVEAGMHLGLVLASIWTACKFVAWLKNYQQARLKSVMRRLKNDMNTEGDQSRHLPTVLKKVFSRITNRKKVNEEVSEGGVDNGKD